MCHFEQKVVCDAAATTRTEMIPSVANKPVLVKFVLFSFFLL
jgi:hypothetical protein